ncbi:MAG TPA: SUF system NifU family Fe-S cluster assembly protein [Candidatus Dormibacteraeota bacterium]|nr:SUF system NifU family Fe-S cluster assembly protein [Candidatus Dormibacteraeota bacterium]
MAASFTPVEDDLYREIILDHYRKPRHSGRVSDPTAVVEANNPLCGDEITLTLRSDGSTVTDVAFEGQGCSISQASASMLCDAVIGLRNDDAAVLAAQFRDMLVSDGPAPDAGDLEALQGVKAYPVRVKCATLAWNALLQAIRGEPVHQRTTLVEGHDDRGGA